MSPRSTPPSTVSSGARRSELYVTVACHDQALAFPARRVERLLLSSEVASSKGFEPEPDGQLKPAVTDTPGKAIIIVNNAHYCRWDLGGLFELPALSQAWVLLRVPFEGTELRIAMATGPCLTVQPLGEVTPLPPGLFRRRQNAIWGGFSYKPPKRTGTANQIGLCIDPLRLFSSAELSQAASTLSAARLGQVST